MNLSLGTTGSLVIPSSPTHQAPLCRRMVLLPEQQSELNLSKEDLVQFFL